MGILLLFASLITANEFFGENIQCPVQGATPSVVNTSPWSQRREAKAIVKNVTVQPIKPVYVTLVFVWNSLAGMLLLPKLQLLVCSIILPVVALPAFLCNTVTS